MLPVSNYREESNPNRDISGTVLVNVFFQKKTDSKNATSVRIPTQAKIGKDGLSLFQINDGHHFFADFECDQGVLAGRNDRSRLVFVPHVFFVFVMIADAHHTWYVAFRDPGEGPAVYVRNSRTFRTEIEAKRFARERLEHGCDVSAGTINPHRPKRTIGLGQIARWLETQN